MNVPYYDILVGKGRKENFVIVKSYYFDWYFLSWKGGLSMIDYYFNIWKFLY